MPLLGVIYVLAERFLTPKIFLAHFLIDQLRLFASFIQKRVQGI